MGNNPAKSRLGLLEKPIYQLIEEIEDEAKNVIPPQAESEVMPLTEDNLKKAKSKKSRQYLWTDKYKPQKYVDLLGDDVNFLLHM